MPMRTPVRMLIEIIAVGVLAILIYMVARFLIVGAWAHEAPSGWSYPKSCCANQHCRPIACSTADVRFDGSVEWTGLVFAREMVRISGDAMCHVCVSYDSAAGASRVPHCIFLSPMM
jgi:hypothetical protein